MDPVGAQKEVLDVAGNLGLEITVSVAYEVSLAKSGKTLKQENAGLLALIINFKSPNC